MKPGRPRTSTQAPSPDKSTLILEAALETFARQGFHGVAMPVLARHAGVSIGTLYHYFPSKEALANALFQTLARDLADHLWRDAPTDGSLESRFWCFWRRLSAYGQAHGLGFHYLDLAYHGDYLNGESRAAIAAIRSPTRDLFEEGIRAGVFKHLPSSLGFSLLFGTAHHLVQAVEQDRISWSEELITQSGSCCWDAIRVHSIR